MFGFPDVVIEVSIHSMHLRYMEPREIGDVLLVYEKRIEQMMSYESIKYVKVLKNHGASAGASMSHSHSPSQIMPILIIPPSVSA